MLDITYKIEFKSFWHAGSGLSGGTFSDALVMKDPNGLPFIPGKTIKGLLRDAAVQMHAFDAQIISEEFINTVFGNVPDAATNHVTTPASSFVTDAYLSRFLIEELEHSESLKSGLFQVLTATQIDSNGISKDASLRQIEVSIPLTLFGKILHIDECYVAEMNHCFQWVKRLGLNRSRGLGRCEFSISKQHAL